MEQKDIVQVSSCILCFYVAIRNHILTTIIDYEFKFLADSDAHKDLEDLTLLVVDAIKLLTPSPVVAGSRELSK